MRLFIAVDFNSKEKDSLADIIASFEGHSIKGNFTRPENLHLTIIFLGQTNNLADIKGGMDEVLASAFTLHLKGVGRFRRRGGDIYWIGVEDNKMLQNIYEQLYSSLTSKGFVLEKRRFKPHLTIGREVVMKKDFAAADFESEFGTIRIDVTKISLMRSKRVRGRLIYTPIYSKELRPKTLPYN